MAVQNYRNWLRFAKITDRSLLPHFYGPRVQLTAYWSAAAAERLESPLTHTAGYRQNGRNEINLSLNAINTQ